MNKAMAPQGSSQADPDVQNSTKQHALPNQVA